MSETRGRKGPRLLYRDVNNLDLLVGRCPNGHVHVFGFPQQVGGVIDLEAMTKTARATCSECGSAVERIDRIEWEEGVVQGGLGI